MTLSPEKTSIITQRQPAWLTRHQTFHRIIRPALRKAEAGELNPISIAEFKMIVDGCQMSIHDLHQWAHRYLVKLSQKYPGAVDSNRPSFEHITSYLGPYAKIKFMMALYGHAQRRDALDILLRTYKKTDSSDRTISSSNYPPAKAKTYWAEGGTKAIYICAYCGTEQHFSKAEGRTTLVKNCDNCGAKLRFHHEAESPAMRYYPQAKDEKILQKTTAIREIDCEHSGQGTQVLKGLQELARLKGMDPFQISLWCGRVYLALNTVSKTTIAKFPFEDIGDKKLKLREALAMALKALGGNTQLQLVKRIFLALVDPLNDSTTNEHIQYNPNLEVRFCHACGDIWLHDVSEQSLETIDIQGFDGNRLQLPQLKCKCGSLDTHPSADSNPAETLAENASNRAIIDFLKTHFTIIELELLGMYVVGNNFLVTEKLEGSTIEDYSRELVGYFNRRDDIPSLIRAINQYRHEHGYAGVTRNLSCTSCRAVTYRVISNEGLIGGSCRQCGATEF
ncbi:MAG: hypothetical protein GF390_01940, partial [Candidatus Pacebacteria bacterium]|nr:hypothetical protein [Candidatus Paceibacterota bacterium]